MSPDPSSSTPPPHDSDAVDDSSSQAASDPADARAAAEDALAQIEAMADLDEDPEEESSSGSAGDTEASDEGPLEDQCENCGALLHGPYCSQCGQRSADRIVPIWHMINEALEAVIELDMRVIYTFPKFLFLPGRLTKEYINGRRKRYIRPFRLYLFTTFVLFAALALTTGQSFQFPFNPEGSATTADTVQTASPATSPASGSSIFGSPEEREEWARRIEENPDAVDVQIGDSETQAQLEQYLRVRIAEAVRNPGDFVGSLIDRGPYIMFLMLPVFAFLLKLLYIRRRRLYVEHLIFSLHVHALAFFAFTVGILLGETSVPWLQTAAIWIEIAPFLYLVLAMAHVYEQGFIKSSIKAFILLFIYMIVLSFGFVALLFAAVVFM